MSPAREEKLILCNAPLVGGAMDVTPEQVKTQLRQARGSRAAMASGGGPFTHLGAAHMPGLPDDRTPTGQACLGNQLLGKLE